MRHIDELNAVCTAQAIVATPLGPVLIARSARGLVGLWFEGQKFHPGALAAPRRDDDPLLQRAAAQLRRYFAGDGAPFELPLDLHGTPFQRSVWQSLLQIPAGTTRSYGALASALGAPRAARAVGAAVGRNPVSLLVPCHRAVGSDGALTGYAGGLDRKRALLALEARMEARA